MTPFRQLLHTCGILAVLAFGSAASPAVAEDLRGIPVVIDGDTLDISGTRVRLLGIDAPETKQECDVSGTAWACGRDAKLMLTNATQGREIECRGGKHDRYGRLIAVCYVGDTDLNALMVRGGWALAYRQYAKDYISDETDARANGRGIWRSQFVDPWEWRSAKRQAR
jgi:Micrococcal nuclease (thermonuclease) homologs